MHMPSVAGVAIPWEDGGKKFALPKLDIDAELLFQGVMEDAAWGKLPKPGHPARPEAVDALLGKVNANDFAFGGPLCLRYLSTFAGQAAYLRFLLEKGHVDTRGEAAMPVPAGMLEARFKAERDAGEGEAKPLTELWLKVVSRDFPFATASVPDAAGGATGGPSTPA